MEKENGKSFVKNKRIKPGQLVLLLLFIAVIALPGILVFHDTGRYLPGDNRMAAPLPRLVGPEGRFVTREEIESFVDDNIGFRTAAPQLDSRIMYSMFGAILDDAQLRGKDGNLFAGDDRRFPARRAPYPPLTEDELAENGRNIEAAADYFKTKDIPFLFITIPNKEEVYPDLYPDTFLERPGTSRLAQQVEWLNANTGVDAYDMTQALREKARAQREKAGAPDGNAGAPDGKAGAPDEKATAPDGKAGAPDGMLWYETKDNAHWNYMGAWYGYLEIMGRLKAYDPGLKTLELEDFDVSVSTEPYINWDGSYAFKGLQNTVYTFDYKPGFSCEQISNDDDPWMPQDQLDIAGFQKGGVYFHFHNEGQSGVLVFFGDSYIYQFLLPYFSESFGDVYLFHLPTNYRIMRPVLDMIGADYVVLEMVERTYGTTNIELMAEEFLAGVPVLTRPEGYPAAG